MIKFQGAIAALLDEYKKATDELKEVIRDVSDEELRVIVDTQTEDTDCRSIQTILRHVVRAGYNYVVAIRIWQGEEIDYRTPNISNSAAQYNNALDAMYDFNEKLFLDYPNLPLEEYDEEKKIISRWGQRYDVEQMYEHAIVHILRHRRQIAAFKVKLRNDR